MLKINVDILDSRQYHLLMP